jgi:hypothetical protein
MDYFIKGKKCFLYCKELVSISFLKVYMAHVYRLQILVPFLRPNTARYIENKDA